MTYEHTSTKSLNEAKYGFWGVLARKAKSILEDDIVSQQIEDYGRSHPQMLDKSAGNQVSDKFCIFYFCLLEWLKFAERNNQFAKSCLDRDIGASE